MCRPNIINNYFGKAIFNDAREAPRSSLIKFWIGHIVSKKLYGQNAGTILTNTEM